MPEDENGAAILAEALSDRSRLSFLERLNKVRPEGRFDFDAVGLQEVRDALHAVRRFATPLERADAAPQRRFDAEFARGYFGAMRFLDDAALASRVHVLAAAPALAEGDLLTVIERVSNAWRWADALARTPRVEARLVAGQLRGEALSVVEAAAARRDFQRADAEKFAGLLRDSLTRWPKDSFALIGDRALTMHAYEAVRGGALDELLTVEERLRFEHRGLLKRLQQLAPQAIDRDQVAYLDAMRELIAAADDPYHVRREAIDSLFRRFDPHSTEQAAAPLATHLFLPGLAAAIEEFARERAACEAWLIALASTAGLELPRFKTNPVTGVAYAITRTERTLTVNTGDPQLRDPVVPTPRSASP